MPKLTILKTAPAPPGCVCAREALGFTDRCEVCGKNARVFSFAFSDGPEVESADGVGIQQFHLTGFQLCSHDCFTKTRYFKAQMSGKPTCSSCHHLAHVVGKCEGCGCGTALLRDQWRITTPEGHFTYWDGPPSEEQYAAGYKGELIRKGLES